MDMSSGGTITSIGARSGHTHPASDVDALAASAITAQGQILAGTGQGTYAPVSPGPDGYAIVADSTADAGLAYAPVAALEHDHTQNESHNSPDTDASALALHHTLGDGEFQAAAGNHTHTDIFPVGGIIPFAGISAPSGWLICDGSVVAETQYPLLAAICGATYGTAPAGMFRLPDLKGRLPVGLSQDSSFNSMGKTGGSATFALLKEHLPSHDHTIPSHGHTTAQHTHTIANHQHSIEQHRHTTPNHSHDLSETTTGDHGHSVGVTLSGDGTHQHDTRITDVTGVRGSSSGQLANRLSTNTGNSTASSGHSHTLTVSQTSTGDHTHSVSVTSSGSGDSGYTSLTSNAATISPEQASVTVNVSDATVSGSTGSGTAVPVMNPYMTLQFIIKAA